MTRPDVDQVRASIADRLEEHRGCWLFYKDLVIEPPKDLGYLCFAGQLRISCEPRCDLCNLALPAR